MYVYMYVYVCPCITQSVCRIQGITHKCMTHICASHGINDLSSISRGKQRFIKNPDFEAVCFEVKR